ncbi:hypothetical protein ABW20_dc0105856 [Dactylellina cionopaga]|nr:hypothetical protein ABW20_dc0105856 [Dactylellina cionopaga]
MTVNATPLTNNQNTMVLEFKHMEVTQQIIAYVPDDDLQALERVSRRLHQLTNDSLLWRGRCSRFKYWEDHWHNNSSSADGHYQALRNWKRVFYRRITIEREACQLLDHIVASPSRRIEHTEKIASYGYDVKDYLIEQLAIPETANDWLARRFHASSTLAYIHRQRAMCNWSKLVTPQFEYLEQAMSGFDLFIVEDFNADSEHVSVLLSAISADILSVNRNFFDLTVKERATAIVRYMRSLGFHGCLQENFYNLVNCFMGVSMRTTKSTLPMISCTIFCSLAHRLGLDAYPCAYPYHVYVLIREPNNQHFYMNPHDGVDLIFQPELEIKLQEMGITINQENITKFLRPATTKELVLRNARNILRNTPQARRHLTSGFPQPEINIDAAEYAALFSIALLSSAWTTRILEPLCRSLQESFPLDVGLIEKYIIPLANPESRPARLLKTICGALRNEDGMIRKAKRRSLPENSSFRIGTIFQHKRYGYQAVITGWTINMTYEGVDAEEAELQKGLMQPFYRVMVDDLSVRYVAQENILEHHPKAASRLGHISAGRYFKRFNVLEGRFVSNMKEEYPED